MSSVSIPSTTVLQAGACGKIILVTGAASGIGLAMTRLFAAHGATVVMVDVSLERLEDASSRIHGSTATYKCDVSSWEQQVEMFEWVVGEFGRLDVICCNAGIDPEIAMACASSGDRNGAVGVEGTEEPKATSKTNGHDLRLNWLADEQEDNGKHSVRRLKRPSDAVWRVNVDGIVFGIKLAIYHMSNCSRSGADTGACGKIIITGSAGSYIGVAGQDMYAASKHALLGLLRSTSARPELREKAIALSMINPWLTATPMVANLDLDIDFASVGEGEGTVKKAPVSQPEDVAWAAAYLLAAKAFDDVNGKCLWVRGTEVLEVEGSYGRWLDSLS